jgi:hypothetical protein
MVLKGGNKAKGGLYWKKREWEIVTVEGKDGVLPGGGDTEYFRIPGTLFAPVALILGLAFYVFLPLLGFAMVLSLVAKKVRALFAPHAHQPPSGEHLSDLHPRGRTSGAAHIHTGGGLS